MPRALLIALALAGVAHAEAPGYPWRAPAAADTVETRFAPPPGTRRAPLAPGSFGAWLRGLPLLPAGAEVHLFDGRRKARQDVHAAVVDLDVGARDLQQCADAVMRLRAEYLFAAGRFADIRFHPDPGKPRALAWTGGAKRDGWARFLVRLFADAGTASLAAELPALGARPLAPGDVLIQPGYPGHAVLVLDAADGAGGRRFVLLGQSYMPAQQFHLLRNPASPSPWYDAAALDGAGLLTPEWPRPFTRKDARRFPP